MSWEPLTCSVCRLEGEFERVGRLDVPNTFAVAWLCPGCGGRLVEMCPIGDDVPVRGACLNCGAAVDDAGTCAACGVSRPELIARITEQCGASPTLARISALAERGLVRLAFNALDLRLESQPEDRDTWFAKAQLLDEVGLNVRTITPLERALALGAPPALYISVGVALALDGRHEQAIARFATYLEAVPDTARERGIALVHSARSLQVLGRTDEAEAQLEQALRRDADDLQARVDLHTLLVRERRFSEALETLDLALAKLGAADRVRLLPSRAELLCELMRGEEAVASIEEALVAMPDNPRVLYTHGRALALTGEIERALTSMARVVELDGDDQVARRALAALQAARLH